MLLLKILLKGQREVCFLDWFGHFEDIGIGYFATIVVF